MTKEKEDSKEPRGRPRKRPPPVDATVTEHSPPKASTSSRGNGLPPSTPSESVVLGTLTMKSIAWCMQGRIPYGQLSLVYGASGSGKTTAIADVIAAQTTGRLLPDNAVIRASSVLIFSSEESLEYQVMPRLWSAGADMHAVVCPERLRNGKSRRFLFPVDEQTLIREIRAWKARLVVFDPLSIRGDQGSLAETGPAVRETLECLFRVASETETAIVGIKHPRKGRSGAASDRVAGSAEWYAVPASVIECTRPPDGDGRLFVMAKWRCCRKAAATLRFTLERKAEGDRVLWAGATQDTHDDLSCRPTDPLDIDALEQARRFLRAILADGKQAAVEVLSHARAEGHSDRTMQRAATEERVTREREGSGLGSKCYWTLPEMTDEG